ncbi:MAG: class I SAM-dependent methyltransferase [Gammaproteobacteria bacterium]
MTDYIENNKVLWNGWAKINSKSDFYDVEGFKSGKTSLKKVELSELGDVKGKSILHLQCHFGLDTLSWAREGAKVTGVDFSDEAINVAKQLSAELNIPAEFICSDVYELDKILDKKFDIVFTSYGVLCWLSNLDRWADIVAHFLKPGGTFYIVEFHPFTNIFDESWTQTTEPYFYGKDPIRQEQSGSYADNKSRFDHASYEWPHSLCEVVNSLRQAGIIIDFMNEFPFSSYNCFPNLQEIAESEYTLKDRENALPMMYSIKATYRPELAKQK